MNSIIKRQSGTSVSDRPELSVKPVDLTPIGSLIHAGLEDLDPALIKDPVLRAEVEARLMLRAAQEEADAVRQQAYDEGFRSGAEQAAAEAHELIERLEAGIEAIAVDRAATLDAVEPQVLKLCMEIVEKVIRHEAKSDVRVVMRVIKSCLRRIKDSDYLEVRVSPQEIEEVKARCDELVGLADGAREIRIVDDRRISPGGCVIESSSGDYDAQVESQLGKIDAKLTEKLENDRNQPHPQAGPNPGYASGPGEVLDGDRSA